MKLRHADCIFAMSQCHYNVNKHLFVLRNLLCLFYYYFDCTTCVFCNFYV